MKDEKKLLREAVFAEIAALPEDYIKRGDEAIFENVTSTSEFKNAERIFIYYSVGREPDTHQIIRRAFELGKTVALPLCRGGGVMEARAVENLSALQPGVLGIPAPPPDAPVIPPEELDLIVVPAVAFDRAGYRLGYGGGYYDRYLPGIPVFKMGIARDRLVRDALPREAHDIRVDAVITEKA